MENIIVFSKEWFKKHNKKLCFLANAPIIKYWFRWLLRIHKDIPWNEKIEEIMPNAFTYGKKLTLTKDGLRYQQTTDFRTHEKFGKRLYYGLKPFWYLLHFWDYATVLEPKLNLGFDTLTVYPVPGTTKDGEVAYQNLSSGDSFSTVRNANGNYVSSSTNSGVSIHSSNVKNLWYRFHRYICLFDTSSLTSSAIISAATISFNKPSNWYAVDDFSTYLSICSSNPSSNTSLEAGDYQTLGTTSFSNFWIGNWATGYNNLGLNSSGLSNISKTGISKFGARIKRDLDNDPPTWAYLKMSSVPFFYANTEGTTADPKLVVTYTIVSVTTQALTNVLHLSATANGNITSQGEGVSTRGFCYLQGTTGDPTVSDNKVYDTGSFSTGAYSKSITGLVAGTSYRVRSYAISSGVITYGSTVDLETNALDYAAVTTNTETDLKQISLTANGKITDDGNGSTEGGTSVTRRGFCYKEGTSGDPTTSDSVVYDDGSFGVGNYSKKITGLTETTSYRLRSYVVNSVGTSYGDTIQILTATTPTSSGSFSFITLLNR